MDEHSLHGNENTKKIDCLKLDSVRISQHSFGFVHGFVFCLVLKNVNQPSGKITESSDDNCSRKSVDLGESSQLVSFPSQETIVSCAEFKEKLSDVQTEEENTCLHNNQSDLTATASQHLQTELTEKGSKSDYEKHSPVSSFYLHLTDNELESNDVSDSEKWTDSCDYQACDSPDVKKDDQSSTSSDKRHLRKRQRTTIPEIKDTKRRKRTRETTESQKSTSTLAKKSKTKLTPKSKPKIVQKSKANAKKVKASSGYSKVSAAWKSEPVANKNPTSDTTLHTDDAGVTETVSLPQVSGSQLYPCSKCNKTFTTARSCKRHTTKVHLRNGETNRNEKGSEKVIAAQCDKCPKMYTGGRAEKNLRQHVLAYHSDVNPVQCDVCSVTLNNEHHLKLHKRSSHRKDVCYICGAHFVTQIGLQTHLLAHKGDKSFVCEICGAAFVRVSSLRQHTKFHTDSRDFKCGRCPLSFKTFSSLSIHMMCVHQCGSYFSSQVQKLAKLGYVIETEKMERLQNYQCISCGQDLVDSACPLHSSDCMHSFSCPQCQWTTKDIQKFRKHLVRRNSATTCSGTSEPKSGKSCGGLTEKNRPLVKNFICPSCGKHFYTQSHLQAHRHQHAEKRFSCPVCEKSFTYKFNMQNHLTTHTDARPFECQVCQKTFKMKSQLQLHQRYHDGEFKCEICGKVLTRKQHVLNHYKLVHPETQMAS